MSTTFYEAQHTKAHYAWDNHITDNATELSSCADLNPWADESENADV